MPAADAFPALDYDRSPYTGWTRAHWEALLARLTYGYVLAAERSGSPARALYPDDRRGYPDAVDALESFARLASAWGAWLSQPDNPACLAWAGRTMDLEALLRQALLEGTDPANPYTYWGDIGHMDQRIVESADMAVTVWLTRERVLARMAPTEQAQVMRWLAQVDGKGTYADNWILFPAMAQAVRLRLGFESPEAELDGKLDQVAEFYRGDGWYVDGLADEFELYNAWMFNWHYLLWAWIDGDRRPEYCRRVLDRARSFLSGFLHFFGANGAHVAWGRSVVYRFAAVAALQTGYRLGVAPAAPGQLRRACSGNLRYFYERGLFNPLDHSVPQGFHGSFPPAGEPYISPGSVYWCAHGLFALALPPDDPFWTEVEGPLPVEQADFELVLPAPGFAVSGRRSTGQVLLLNSRSGQEYDGPGYHYAAKYGKLAYSSHFPFNVLAVRGAPAPDSMVALTRDGRQFGHRLRTRHGAVAPGLMWCRFDEMLDGEVQPLWAAVLLWGDRQIRLTLIRPTFPVWAVEAPGALGCELPAGIRRRSDRQAGWEYAEAEGRAVGIRRLLGYDDQRASAPFLDQSNLNLAYPYAEQPVVCEAQASPQPRCLAAISLVRPASFDPAEALDEVTVLANIDGAFRVDLAGGEQAFVGVGEVLPARVSLAGLAFHGHTGSLRYARALPGALAVSGLGVSRVDGVAEFAAPATFGWQRDEAGQLRLTTDRGVAFDRGWLGGQPRQVTVSRLDGTAADVGAECGDGAIPDDLVRQWAERLQRRLVEFRIQL